MKRDLINLLFAAVGGAVGYFAFFWAAGQGFYALAIPGGLLGLGASLGKPASRVVALVCGLAALTLGLLTEWRFRPFIADQGIGYFLTHLHQLQPVTMLMIALGAALGFWLPFSRQRRSTPKGRE